VVPSKIGPNSTRHKPSLIPVWSRPNLTVHLSGEVLSLHNSPTFV